MERRDVERLDQGRLALSVPTEHTDGFGMDALTDTDKEVSAI